MDTDERSALYGQWNARFVELAPSIVLALSTRAVRTARALAGATDGVLFTLGSRFHDAHLWPVAPSQ